MIGAEDADRQWPAVVARGLWKTFDHKTAVAGVDLDVPRGCFFGLVGPNGAGKTTTIRMMTALLRPDHGQVWIEQHDVWHDPVGRRRGSVCCRMSSVSSIA